MKNQYVYLRPRPVLFSSADGPASVVGRTAWKRLDRWCASLPHHDTVARGYGLIYGIDSNDHEVIFEAAIDVPFQGNRSDGQGLGVKTLPGGPYARQRSTIPHPASLDAIMDFRNNGLDRSRFKLDPTRPCVQVMLGNPFSAQTQDINTELLLPLALSEERDTRLVDADETFAS